MGDRMNKREIKLCLNSVFERAERLESLASAMSQKTYRSPIGKNPTAEDVRNVLAGAKEHYALKQKLSAMLNQEDE